MKSESGGLAQLADHLQSRREPILAAWRDAIKRDRFLTTSNSLPRADLHDHIPALLSNFEHQLRGAAAGEFALVDAGQDQAAAHGLQRWQQGYDLREVTRELGKLNEILVAELEAYRGVDPVATGAAGRLWALLCGTGIEESVAQYFQLQQQEAAGHAKDLEAALAEVRELEKQRADLWREAAHDLRGNLGVVANATVGLTREGLRESLRDRFVSILMRNVTSLHHLLNDVTDLARLQAGREARRIETLDVSPVFQQLCEGVRPLADDRRLFVLCRGPQSFTVDGDQVKIRRIAQNLILNAVKFTEQGGITVTWGDSALNDPKRWELCIQDTGPGFHAGSDKPLTHALEKANQQATELAAKDAAPPPAGVPGSLEVDPVLSALPAAALASGEGLGLSIVKRMCDLLDATIEMSSTPGVGTTFRILLPRRY